MSSPSVASLLRDLIYHFLPESARESAHPVALRLLQSSLHTPPSTNSVEALTKNVLLRLMRERKHDHASKFAAMASSLKLSSTLNATSVWPVLYVLAELQGTSAEQPSFKSGDALALENSDIRVSAPSTQLAQTHISSPLKSPNFSLPALPANSPSKVSFARTQISPTSLNHDPPVATRKPASATPTTLQTPSLERALIRDLLLIVQGHQATLLSFDNHTEEEDIIIHLPASTTLSLATHNIIHCVGEAGFLFRLIQRRVDQVETNAISPDSNTISGHVVTNLCRAIAREIDVYYKSLALLRQMDNIQGTAGLTLRRMKVWADTEIPRLRWLARLCDETTTLRGSQILSHVLRRRASYVSTDIREMMSRILTSTAAPINRMLIRWLAEGELVDPDGEFFIREDPKVAATMTAGPFSGDDFVEEDTRLTTQLAGGMTSASLASHRIWWGLFKMRKDMFAGSVNLELAQRALITGKSIAFLRRCCSDGQWVDQVHAPLVTKLTGGGRRLFEADHRFDRDVVRQLIVETRDSACKRLKELFFDKFDLSHHFGAIKRYLLLSQGDFAQALMDGLAPILDGGPNILRSNLTGTIDAALQGCSSFNMETDQDILERLDVQIITQEGAMSSGWDVFSLVYRVQDAPLNTVFSEKVMEAYFEIFRFLWRLKRMDYLMTSGYLKLREVERRAKDLWDDGEDGGNMRWVVKRLHYLRMKMTHLIHNLQHYCTVEVLEGSWAVLEREMKMAEDLDGMIQAHAKYLTVIKDRTLLSDRSKYVAEELNGVLDTIPRFNKLQAEVCAAIERGELGGEVGEVGEELKIMLEEVEVCFDDCFERLLKVIAKHTKMVDTCVFLLFRLDYNRYYANREVSSRQVPEEGGEEG